MFFVLVFIYYMLLIIFSITYYFFLISLFNKLIFIVQLNLYICVYVCVYVKLFLIYAARRIIGNRKRKKTGGTQLLI